MYSSDENLENSIKMQYIACGDVNALCTWPRKTMESATLCKHVFKSRSKRKMETKRQRLGQES